MSAEASDRLVTGGQASVYALLADGTTVEIRPATPGDLTLVRAMHEAMSPENGYRRFFSLSKLSAGREAERVCRAPAPDHAGGGVSGPPVLPLPEFQRLSIQRDQAGDVGAAVTDRHDLADQGVRADPADRGHQRVPATSLTARVLVNVVAG